VKYLFTTLLLFSFFNAKADMGKPEEAAQIPGMQLLLKMISQMPVSELIRQNLRQVVEPSKDRTYYRGDESSLDPAQLQALIQKYATILQVPPEKVALFGVTIADKRTTLLLPEFYQLKSPQEQAAALLHESLWILKSPNVDYATIVRLEKAALAYLQKPTDPSAYFSFYNNFSDIFGPGFLLDAALAYDSQKGLLPMTPLAVFGRDYFICSLLGTNTTTDLNCDNALREHLLSSDDLQTSLFLQALDTLLASDMHTVMPRRAPLNPIKNGQEIASFLKPLSLIFEHDSVADHFDFVLIRDGQRVGIIHLD